MIKFNGLFLIYFTLVNILDGQNSIEYVGTRESLPFHFVRTEVSGSYFIASDFADGNNPGSELYKWDEDLFYSIDFIYQLSDSLICNQVVDLWKEDNKITFLAYAKNTFSNDNYLVLATYDEPSGEIMVLDIVKFENWKIINTRQHKDLIVNGIRNSIFYEHYFENNKPKAITRVEIVGQTLNITRHSLPKDFSETFLWDSYYDSSNEEYIVNIGKYLYVLDKNFTFKEIINHNITYNNTIFSGLQRMIIGQDMEEYHSYERIRDPSKGNLILLQRAISYRDSLSFNKNALLFNSSEDCYYVKKLAKKKSNYLYYSRSSFGNFDNNYGFTILVFNKIGNILKKHEIKTNRPCVLNDLDVNEQNNIAYGVVQYWDNAEQEAFRYDLGDVTLSNEDTQFDDDNMILHGILPGINIFKGSHLLDKEGVIFLFDIGGKLVCQYNAKSENIDLSYIPSGLYFVCLKSKNVQIVQKIVLITNL